MVLPAIAPAALAGLKAFGGKHLLSLLLGGAFLGSEALSQYGKAGERGLSREQIKLQTLLGESQAKAAERSTKESRAQTEKYTKALLKAQAREKKEAREMAMLQSFTQSQDRQMALVLQAVQAMTQSRMRPTRRPSSGMVDMMRSSL